MRARTDSVPPAPVDLSTASEKAERRYCAFISYSHADAGWARWLMRRLEGYRVPERFHGRAAPIGVVGRRIAPVFRDRDELPTTSDLGETIRAALRASATLVVICSPRSARSRWVQEEIAAFKRMHGERRVFAFIVAGEPKHAGAEDDCFSPALRVEVDPDGRLSARPAEVVAADARDGGDGPRLAFVRLVAGLLGVGFDDLRQRELVRRNRRLTLIAVSSAVGMAVTLGLAVTAWRARNDAERRQDQAEDVLGFMVGDFRADLEKVGQLALLEKVGDKAMAYFDALEAADLTDTALARQAKTLTQIGEVRLLQKDVRYAEAARAFMGAYRRAAELVVRHPGNSAMLFERGQAEFWIASLWLKQSDVARAITWLERYRETSVALVALEPRNLKWQDELVMAYHNLAVVELRRGNPDAAEAGLQAERRALEALAAAEPGDLQRKYRIADNDSWLGNVAQQKGEYRKAEAFFAAQQRGLEALVAIEPANTAWSFKLADCLFWVTDAHIACGEFAGAARTVERGEEIIGKLLEREPRNRRWLNTRSALRLRRVALLARTDARQAEVVVQKLGDELEAQVRSEPADREARARLLAAWRLRVRLMVERRADATELAAKAYELGSSLAAEKRLTARVRGELAHVAILLGRTAALVGKTDEARKHWESALGWTRRDAQENHEALLLDPAARAHALLGEAPQAETLMRQLQGLGYVPLEPWPTASGEKTLSQPKP